MLGSDSNKGEQRESIWEQEEQYMMLVPLDREPLNRSTDNEHPYLAKTNNLKLIFGSLVIEKNSKAIKDSQYEPLFSKEESIALAELASQAFSVATPEQDIAFNIAGRRRFGSSMLGVKYWTKGRLFYTDGRLNIVINQFRFEKRKDTRIAEAMFGILQNTSAVTFAPTKILTQENVPWKVRLESTGVLFFDSSSVANHWVAVDIDEQDLPKKSPTAN